MSYIQGNLVEKTNFSAVAQTLVLNVAGLNSVRFEFSGVYSFISIFESSSNSTNGVDGVWFGLVASRTDVAINSTSHSTTNATNAYKASCHNDKWVRIRIQAFTSAGVHRVALVGSTAAVEPVPAIVFPTSQIAAPPIGVTYTLVTTATTNGALIFTAARGLFELSIANPTATAISVKLYNKATAPIVGTDVPLLTQTVAGGATELLNFGHIGKRFTLGIGIAATALPAATDTGVAVAGVQIHGTYL